MSVPTPKVSPPREVPMMGQLIPRGDGTFTLKPRLPDGAGETWLKTIQAVKLSGQSCATLYRLAEVGLIKSRRPTPTKWEFELGSLQSYLEKIQDPEFWEKRRAEVRQLSDLRR